MQTCASMTSRLLAGCTKWSPELLTPVHFRKVTFDMHDVGAGLHETTHCDRRLPEPRLPLPPPKSASHTLMMPPPLRPGRPQLFGDPMISLCSSPEADAPRRCFERCRLELPLPHPHPHPLVLPPPYGEVRSSSDRTPRPRLRLRLRPLLGRPPSPLPRLRLRLRLRLRPRCNPPAPCSSRSSSSLLPRLSRLGLRRKPSNAARPGEDLGVVVADAVRLGPSGLAPRGLVPLVAEGLGEERPELEYEMRADCVRLCVATEGILLRAPGGASALPVLLLPQGPRKGQHTRSSLTLSVPPRCAGGLL